jgi:hypothetical protein
MPDIKDVVNGTGSQVQDIAMIQMMLKVIKDAKAVPYLKVNYSGVWNADTQDAIQRFQTDQGLLATAKAPAKGGNVMEVLAADLKVIASTGLVEPNSKTLAALNKLLPADYKDAIILPGGHTVYLPGKAGDAAASSGKLRGEIQLDMKFRQKAADFVDAFYKQTKIVISTPPGTGTRRDFQGQMTVVSGAGPGESNHQFGQAADIGFGALRWVDGDGTIRKDTFWLNAGAKAKQNYGFMTKEKTQEFFKVHHEVRDKAGIFKCGLPGDELHVQAYSDSTLSYTSSLAKLLNLTGKMNWEGVPHKGGNRYKSDFGLGGKTFELGTAKQVFGGNAVIDKANVAAALNAFPKDLAKLAVFKDFQYVKDALQATKPGKLPPPVTGAKIKATDIKDADLALLRKAAKADWSAADKNWKQWVPVK